MTRFGRAAQDVRLSTRLMAAMVGLVLLTAAIVALLSYRDVAAAVVPYELGRQRAIVVARLQRLDDTVRSAGATVMALRHGSAMTGLVEALSTTEEQPADAEAWLAVLGRDFMAVLEAEPLYVKLRFIGPGERGREVLRADRFGPDDAVRVVPAGDLQEKGERSFVRRTAEVPNGSIHVSRIDLNQEHGRVQMPPLPVIRVGTPVHAADGRLLGTLIVNVDMRPALDRLARGLPEGMRTYLVNAAGDFLVHPDPARAFGFDLGRPARFQDEYPQLADVLDPLHAQGEARTVLTDTRAGERVGAAAAAVDLGGGPHVAMIVMMPYPIMAAAAEAVRRSGLVAAGAVLLVAVVLAAVLARSLSRPLERTTEALTRFRGDEAIVLPTGGGREIARLSRAFTEMAAQVRERTAALARETEERRRTEAALARTAELERLFLAVAESSEDAIVTKTPDGRITAWNPGAERLFGYTAEEAIGRNVDMIVPPELRQDYHRTLDRLARGEAIHHYETVRVAKDGRRVEVSLSISPLRSPSGQIVGSAKIARDVTSRNAAQEKAQRAQRLEAIGQLTGGIAHDFNNLLQVVLGGAQALAANAGDEAVRRQARTIAMAAERGAELTAGLLAFARRQPLAVRSVDVNALLRRVEILARRTLGEDIALSVVPAAGAAFVAGDEAQLETAILNLCLNARDAMPDGGRLVVEASLLAVDASAGASPDELPPGRYVQVAVTDTGTGMTPDVMARVFEPFFTTKPAGKGTGLGLSMVYGLIRQLGGEARIYSEPGQGTSVKLYLPQAAPAPAARSDPAAGAAPPRPPSSPRPNRGRGERILVVEDNDLVRQTVRIQLETLGYAVVEAENGRDAIGRLDEIGPVDLLFTDVIMTGGINGQQVAEAVAARWPGTRVLFTSGYTERAAIFTESLSPTARLLSKPYKQSELARRIREALDGTTEPAA